MSNRPSTDKVVALLLQTGEIIYNFMKLLRWTDEGEPSIKQLIINFMVFLPGINLKFEDLTAVTCLALKTRLHGVTSKKNIFTFNINTFCNCPHFQGQE
jgi:hypothetical protein